MTFMLAYIPAPWILWVFRIRCSSALTQPLSPLSQFMELRSEPSATWHWRIQRPREQPQLPTPKMRYGTTLPTAHICPPKHPEKGWKRDSPKYSVVICRIHAHIHISTDWLWHAFDDVGTCWACFFPKENGSKPIPRKNGTRNPSSTATISNHWNPADLRWFIFPNRPTCKNLAGGTRPWRLRGSRTTMNKKWKNSLHLSAYEGLPPNTRFRRNIFVRYVIITNLLLQPSYWTGPPECFQRKNMVFPPSTCHHMIIWSTTGYPEVQGCACLPIFLGHPHVKNEPTAICMHPEHHDHWYGHILYAAT